MTYAFFVAGLRALTVTGVRRVYDAPPSQLSTAQLPAMYPRLPEGNTSIATLGEALDLFSCAGELVIVVAPLSQDSNKVNMNDAISLMDALHTTLASAADDNQYDKWTIRIENDVIGDTPYWLIVARVEASG